MDDGSKISVREKRCARHDVGNKLSVQAKRSVRHGVGSKLARHGVGNKMSVRGKRCARQHLAQATARARGRVRWPHGTNPSVDIACRLTATSCNVSATPANERTRLQVLRTGQESTRSAGLDVGSLRCSQNMMFDKTGYVR